MIISKSIDGYKRRVIYNQSVLMVDKEDEISFFVKDEKLNYETTFNFDFSNEGEELKTTGTISDDGKTINLTLHKWLNSLGTEVTTPIELSTNIGKRIWVKFRTTAEKKNTFRMFHLTIWGEE